MRHNLVAFLLPLSLFAAGCSTESTSPASPASATDAADPAERERPSFVARPVDAKDPSGACHALENSAPLVGDDEIVGTRPSFVGGAVEPGLYYRVKTIRYVNEKSDGGPPSKRQKQTLRIHADGTTEVVHANEGAADDPTTFTLATSGSELRFSETCPTTRAPQTILYTATPTELSIAQSDDGVLVFRRQQ